MSPTSRARPSAPASAFSDTMGSLGSDFFRPRPYFAVVHRMSCPPQFSLTLSSPAIKLSLVPLNLFRTHLEHSCADPAAVGGRDGQALAIARPCGWQKSRP